MDLINRLEAFFKQAEKDTKNIPPKGYCPNCWGQQEYDHEIRNLYEDKQIDVNNHEANYAFIQDFVVNHLEGIHLIKGNNGYECPTCHTKYKRDSQESA